MTAAVIIAIDAGTSMLKAVAFDRTGAIVAASARPNIYREAPGGLAEQDMARTWDEAAAGIAGLIGKLGGAPIIGLTVTGQGDGTWLIDAEGSPVGPAMLWLDGRAGRIVERIRTGEAGRDHFRETGTGLAACHQSGQILWLAQHHPERLARAATALHCKDWLYFNLTGERVTDPSEGCFTYGSWRSRGYSQTTITALGFASHRRLLPPIIDGTTTNHPLTAAAAARLGLKPGLPVVLGYIDTVCSGLGAGIYGTGDDPTGLGGGASIIGSTGINMRLADTDFELPDTAPMSGFRVVFPVPGKTALMQSMLAATLNIDWLVGIADHALRLAGHQPDPVLLLATLDQAVLAASPAQALYHPYIATAGERGPFTDPAARASLSGISRGLDLAGTMRTIYEGLALAAADCYAAMGGAPAMISLTGGAARSAPMRAIFAAMLNRPVRIVREHGSGALGAAMIAAVSLGVMPDMATCAAQWVQPLLGDPEPPDAGLAATYAPLLALYRNARAAMPEFWHGFAAYQEAIHRD